MTDQEILGKLEKIVKIYLPADVDPTAVQRNAHFINELNINSANLVDVALDVEDEFDITLDEQDMNSMTTLESTIEIIKSKLN